MFSTEHTVKFVYLAAFVTAVIYVINSGLFMKNETKIFFGYKKEFTLNFTELAAANGYISQEHVIITEDGYVLKIFRIIKAKKCSGTVKKPPVVLMHGLLSSSDVWLDAGPNSGLAYLLSDACYDLWVGNQRGNYYGRNHKTLNPNKDAKFWEFSVDEIGYYDVPATIDYVLDYTHSEKVNYIGYSQGSGTVFVMCSERPEYCQKVNLHIALAPATRIINMPSMVYRTFFHTVDLFSSMLMTSGAHELFSRGSFCQAFLSYYCQMPILSGSVCVAVKALTDASHPGSISKETSHLMFSHFPAGTSVRTLVRYNQALQVPCFQKFDHGESENIQFYNSTKPPQYNLSEVTVPVVIIYGRNDKMVSPVDVDWLVNQLPNVISLFEVKDPLWNHYDFIYSQYTDEFLFPKINEYLSKYST